MADGPSSAAYDEAGTTPIGVIKDDDILRDASNVEFQGIHVVGSDLIFQNIVGTAQNNVNRLFPYDGDGLLDAYSAGTPSATLDATGVDANLEGAGLLLAMMTGSAVGEVRRIISYNKASRVATLNAAFASAPSAGNQFVTLINCYKKRYLHLKFELVSNDATKTITIEPWLFDCGRSDGASLSTKRAPRVTISPRQIIESLGVNTYSTDGSTYYHCNTYTLDVQGYTGAKIKVIDSSGANHLTFAGCS